MRDLISVLFCQPGKVAAKTFAHASGVWDKVRDYDAGWLFSCTPVDVSSLADLEIVLATIQPRPNAMVIRGEPIPGFDLASIRRISNDQPDGDKARFREPENGHHWFELDFDGVRLAEPFEPSNPEQTIETLISRLPGYFRDTSCFWQLSSSMGLRDDPLECRARLWFWSDRPIRDAEMKLWIATLDPELRVDDSLFNPVQPHYVAAPILDAPDPLPRRSGLRPGTPTVSIPVHVVPYAAGETFGAYERRMSYLGDGPGRGGFHDVLLGAIAAWVGAGRGELGALKSDVRLRVDAAPCLPPRTQADVERYKSDAYLDASIAGAVSKFGKQAASGAYEILNAKRIFAPLPDVDYLVRNIGITKGAPTLIAGYGYSGKTAAVQQLAINLARPDLDRKFWDGPGRPVWGKFSAARRARVLHVDYEQGAALTRRRYQRLALAEGLGEEDLAGWLELVSLPQFYLNQPAGLAALEHICEGVDLVIVDSFRAANPGLEENSSDAREPLDALNRISERTGCASIVIHHARKPSQDKPGGAKMSIRGSGAIFDGSASVLVFEGEKDAPKNVSHEKERNSGITEPDFELEIVDVEGGFQVRAKDIVIKTDKERLNEQVQADSLLVREYLEKNMYFTNHKELRIAMGVSMERVSTVVGAMIRSGALVKSGSEKSHVYQLSGVTPTNGTRIDG